MAGVIAALGKIGTAILFSLLTEKVMIKLILLALEKIAKSTKNKIDDDVVKVVKEALEK